MRDIDADIDNWYLENRELIASSFSGLKYGTGHASTQIYIREKLDQPEMAEFILKYPKEKLPKRLIDIHQEYFSQPIICTYHYTEEYMLGTSLEYWEPKRIIK